MLNLTVLLVFFNPDITTQSLSSTQYRLSLSFYCESVLPCGSSLMLNWGRLCFHWLIHVTLFCFFLFSQRREARKQEQANNPFYIKASPSSQKVLARSLTRHWALFSVYVSFESSHAINERPLLLCRCTRRPPEWSTSQSCRLTSVCLSKSQVAHRKTLILHTQRLKSEIKMSILQPLH